MNDLGQLSSLLAPILSDPEAMAGIAQAAAQLGLGDMLPSAPEEGPVPPAANNANAASNTHAAEAPADTPDSPAGGAAPAVSDSAAGLLAGLMPLLSGAGDPDDSARLLSALRPFLHGDRAKRLESARRMVRLTGVVKLLGSSGLLSEPDHIQKE